MKKLANESRRRAIALVWLAIVISVVGTLLYFEQVEIIFVLASVALIALLSAVAFTDLESVKRGDEIAKTSTDQAIQTDHPKVN